jgi:hypothetical protein
MQEGPGFSQLLEELELELLQALAEENPHILLVQQHALPSLRVVRPWAANEFVSEGVESGDVWEGGKVGQGLADARFHLSGSLLRKGQGQNVMRFKSGGVLEQMDNPLGNDTGLAASRARNNEQRSIAVFNRPQLFRVELQHECKSGVRIQRSGFRQNPKIRDRDLGFREKQPRTPLHPESGPAFIGTRQPP